MNKRLSLRSLLPVLFLAAGLMGAPSNGFAQSPSPTPSPSPSCYQPTFQDLQNITFKIIAWDSDTLKEVDRYTKNVTLELVLTNQSPNTVNIAVKNSGDVWFSNGTNFGTTGAIDRLTLKAGSVGTYFPFSNNVLDLGSYPLTKTSLAAAVKVVLNLSIDVTIPNNTITKTSFSTSVSDVIYIPK